MPTPRFRGALRGESKTKDSRLLQHGGHTGIQATARSHAGAIQIRLYGDTENPQLQIYVDARDTSAPNLVLVDMPLKTVLHRVALNLWRSTHAPTRISSPHPLDDRDGE